MVPSLPLMSCELSVSVKENSDRKKKKKRSKLMINGEVVAKLIISKKLITEAAVHGCSSK